MRRFVRFNNASLIVLLSLVVVLAACGGGYAAPNSGSGLGELNNISVHAHTSPSIPVNGTVEVLADGYYGSKQTYRDLQTSATWSTSDASVATVDKGHVIGGGVGSATITATFGGKTGSTKVAVGLTPTVTIVPPTTTFNLSNHDQQFLAQASYSDGTMLDLTFYVTWRSSTETVLAFSVNDPYGFTPGLATFLTTGNTTVTATESAGETGSLALTVVP